MRRGSISPRRTPLRRKVLLHGSGAAIRCCSTALDPAHRFPRWISLRLATSRRKRRLSGSRSAGCRLRSRRPFCPLWWRDRESRQIIREEAERAKRIRFGILAKTEEKQVEKALEEAVQAIRTLPTAHTFKPDHKLDLAEQTYIRLIERELSDDLREGFSAVELWRAEIRHKVMQEEDDDMMLILMSIYIG